LCVCVGGGSILSLVRCFDLTSLVTAMASDPQKLVPLIPKSSLLEQLEEENQGGTDRVRLIWKRPLKLRWWQWS